LKGHPSLEVSTAEQAWIRLNDEIKPDWSALFPSLSVPSLEFITAWEQIIMSAEMSLWEIIEKRVIDTPLKLLDTNVCEGYELYLSIAFHLQTLSRRDDILLPVASVSSTLTKLMCKSVSEQSVSYYARLARNDGYLKLIAKAHHPSGRAARYRFDLTRFAGVGIEVTPACQTAQPCDEIFSQGIKGTQGIEGSHGVKGNQGIKGTHSLNGSSSFLLKHADQDDDTSTKASEKYKESGKIEGIALHSPWQFTMSKYLKSEKKKEKNKRQSVVATWQSVMYSRQGWQKKLPSEHFDTLVRFGRRTNEFGHLILTWVMYNWNTFTAAVGKIEDSPSIPDVPFFSAHEALAFKLWFEHDLNSEEAAAFEEALENCTIDIYDLLHRYMPDKAMSTIDSHENPFDQVDVDMEESA